MMHAIAAVIHKIDVARRLYSKSSILHPDMYCNLEIRFHETIDYHSKSIYMIIPPSWVICNMCQNRPQHVSTFLFSIALMATPFVFTYSSTV